MSKVYVIKNKEGKYVGISDKNYELYWTTIDFAYYWRFLSGLNTKELAENFKNDHCPDCEVVEVTIAEGNLEEEIRVLKRALELSCETIREMCPRPYYICGAAIAERLGIPQVSPAKDYDYFIQQAKEGEDE